MDSEQRAILVQWVVGIAIVVLAAWAALYTPSMSEPPPPPAEQNAPVAQQSEPVGDSDVAAPARPDSP